MRHITRLPFVSLYDKLRPEDKLAMFYFYDAMEKGARPTIKNRRGDNIATILSYAGLIYVIQNKGEYGVVREFTSRGLLFFKYMRDRTNAAELNRLVPRPESIRRNVE